MVISEAQWDELANATTRLKETRGSIRCLENGERRGAPSKAHRATLRERQRRVDTARADIVNTLREEHMPKSEKSASVVQAEELAEDIYRSMHASDIAFVRPGHGHNEQGFPASKQTVLNALVDIITDRITKL